MIYIEGQEYMRMNYSLYLVADVSGTERHSLEKSVEQAIIGGCTAIQLRDKNISDLEFYNLARKIKEVTDKFKIPLIINDRIDVALAVEAAGVHVGQSDLPAEVVRKIINKDMILGVSVTDINEAIRAQKEGADYLGVGAVFSTTTKLDASNVSKKMLKDIKKSVDIPVVAIGGINIHNLSDLLDTNIDGIAVVSAILGQDNIVQASKQLREVLIVGGIYNEL